MFPVMLDLSNMVDSEQTDPNSLKVEITDTEMTTFGDKELPANDLLLSHVIEDTNYGNNSDSE